MGLFGPNFTFCLQTIWGLQLLNCSPWTNDSQRSADIDDSFIRNSKSSETVLEKPKQTAANWFPASEKLALTDLLGDQCHCHHVNVTALYIEEPLVLWKHLRQSQFSLWLNVSVGSFIRNKVSTAVASYLSSLVDRHWHKAKSFTILVATWWRWNLARIQTFDLNVAAAAFNVCRLIL